MDLEFAVAWARHARWHHRLIADADGVLQRELSKDRRQDGPARSIMQWRAHRELHMQMLAEIEQELSNVDLVVAHHGAARNGVLEAHAILNCEMVRRGLIVTGAAL